MIKKSVSPSIREVAFDCPHCGAYTTQTWYSVYAKPRGRDSRTPLVPSEDVIKRVAAADDLEPDVKKSLVKRLTELLKGLPVIETSDQGQYVYSTVSNVHLSKCFACNETAIWVFDRLLFPSAMQGPPPNQDLPDDVLADYREAGRILSLSPRGAAALLRLAIQKICIALGEKGRRIDDDIATLVKKGLSPVVQQALDTVRVVGNEAVHPGTLDLKDDTDTATKLFELVNIIADQMISNPKHVKELYDRLPDSKREAIDKRDGKV